MFKSPGPNLNVRALFTVIPTGTDYNLFDAGRNGYGTGFNLH